MVVNFDLPVDLPKKLKRTHTFSFFLIGDPLDGFILPEFTIQRGRGQN
jgi:CRISPR/Cas system-associated protein endoribonuclease Cas2